jgi:hypothetical protein
MNVTGIARSRNQFDDERPVRRAVLVEGHALTVEHEAGRQLGEAGDARGHVPPATAPDFEAALGREAARGSRRTSTRTPSPVPSDRAGPQEHRSREHRQSRNPWHGVRLSPLGSLHGSVSGSPHGGRVGRTRLRS